LIKPTIGRVVWYHPDAPHTQPWAALVCFVHDEKTVNLTVFDDFGLGKAKLNVPLMQEGDDKPIGMYCEWMPYQIGQAKKHEEKEEK
jgi:hypothetical protein